MDIIIVFILCFIMLISSVFKGIFVAYPLAVGLILFSALAVKKGFSVKEVCCMAYRGGKKSFIVLQIFILIGTITSMWIASGTVPGIVYYGIQYLNPHLFILSAFLISSIISFLIGTSFGTVGTVGVALMVLARGGNINPNIAAGAVIAGAYFGDRCSPMSSSANLVATLTETNIYNNIKNMFKTAALPFFLTVLLYTVLSFMFPLNAANSGLHDEILKDFHVSIIVLLPALSILLLSLYKVDVKKSILISALLAAIIAFFVQNKAPLNLLKYIVFGYTMEKESTLKGIMQGGGIISMLKVALVVFISSAFTGVFEETGMLKFIDKTVEKVHGRKKVFLTTTLISIGSAAFGCTQVLAVILTHILTKNVYKNNKIDNEIFAVDLENTAIVVSPLIPWNIAVLVPLTTLMAGFGSIFYAFYLYLIPITNALQAKYSRNKNLG